MDKIISLIVILAYLVGTYIYLDLGSVPLIGFFLIIPFMCIWFGDSLGEYTGLAKIVSGPYIMSKSPGFLVKTMGWFLFLLPLIVLIVAYGS